ncbi:MAG: type II toxin-antitoxin system RelE/ParE family toxin [Flavobacteriales bacterium]|nr:type II toxin-antitoxin system RelE/ParE family toxin [Flavobacteriales bacterium]
MRLVYTKPALDRIAEIQAYWAAQTSEDKAEAIITSLMEKTRQLCEHPLRGFPERKLAGMGKGYRGFLLGKYKIIY